MTKDSQIHTNVQIPKFSVKKQVVALYLLDNVECHINPLRTNFFTGYIKL